MSLTHMPKTQFAEPQFAESQFARPISRLRLRQPPIAKPAQLIRAILVGLLFAFLFLWAVPHSHMLFASGASGLRLALSV